MRRSNVKVLMYHRVTVDGKGPQDYYWSVTQSQLRNQLSLLQKLGFTCISFEDHSLSLKGKLILPRKPVILTFDDGYHDVYQYALPVLKEFGVRATVFAIGDRSIRTNSWDDPKKYSEATLLDDDMLKELHRAGIEIGSHSMTHADLTRLGKDAVIEEMTQSKASLETLLNSPVISFAYPYGATTPEIQRLAKSAGYEYGCGSYSGPPTFSANLFNIQRTLITSRTDVIGLAFRLLNAYPHYRWMVWKLRESITGVLNRSEFPEGGSSFDKADAIHESTGKFL
jgi:peptidoglycan/xylan/chitin deacetylase (PgdA/CDA1 family)